MATLNVTEENRKKVTSVAGYLMSITGENKSVDDAVAFLLEQWEKVKPKEEASCVQNNIEATKE